MIRESFTMLIMVDLSGATEHSYGSIAAFRVGMCRTTTAGIG